jgi:hypothetical protein
VRAVTLDIDPRIVPLPKKSERIMFLALLLFLADHSAACYPGSLPVLLQPGGARGALRGP